MGIDGRKEGFPSGSDRSTGARLVSAQPHRIFPPRQGVLLHLSGGGYRAAAFHLGALQRLQETGLLSRVTEVRAVSGGALLAAALAREIVQQSLASLAEIDWARFAPRIRELMMRDARTMPVLLTLGVNAMDKRPRLWLLERYLRWWCPELSMSELPNRPAFSFLATDILGGGYVELARSSFERGEAPRGSRSVVGLEDWPVIRAAVTSASFPPLFGPRISWMRDGFGLRRTALLDGGVWGNDAVEEGSLAAALVHLVSDASAPPKYRRQARYGPALWTLRTLKASRERSPALVRYFEFSNIGDRGFAAARWNLQTSHASRRQSSFQLSRGLYGVFDYDGELVRQRIARVRTDLAGFRQAELGVVENHGYLRCAHELSQRAALLIRALRLSEDDGRTMAERLMMLCTPPHDGLLDETVASRALAGSEHRFGPLRVPAQIREHFHPLVPPLEERRRFEAHRMTGDDWLEALRSLSQKSPAQLTELLPTILPRLIRLTEADFTLAGGAADMADTLGDLVDRLARHDASVLTNPVLADGLVAVLGLGWEGGHAAGSPSAVRAAWRAWLVERLRGQSPAAEEWARRAVDAAGQNSWRFPPELVSDAARHIETPGRQAIRHTEE